MKKKDLFNIEKISGLEHLDLVAHSLVDGIYSGKHGSKRMGHADNFVDIRQYEPGDPLRLLDWRAYARTERLHIRKFHDDSNMNVLFILDASASMEYSSTEMSKFAYGAHLIASLALIALKQRDKVALMSINGEKHELLPYSSMRKQFQAILDQLRTVVPGGKNAPHETMLSAIRANITPRSMVIVISDFIETDDSMLKMVIDLRKLRYDVMAIQTMDPLELSFSAEGRLKLVDPESNAKLAVDADDLEMFYHSAISEFLDNIEKKLLHAGVKYFMLNTQEPFDDAIYAILGRLQ